MKKTFLATVAASCFLALAGFSATAETYGPSATTTTQAPTSAPSAPTESSPHDTSPARTATPDAMNSDGTAPDPVATPQAAAPAAPGAPQVAQNCAATGGEIFFETNSDNLDAQSQQALEQSAATLRTCNSSEIVVAGHADARGSDEYNLALSERRAESVRDILVAQGVQASLIRVQALGETQATGDEQRDRRVQVEVRTVSASLPQADPAL